MTTPAPKGEKMSAEERAHRICDDLEGRKMGKQQIAIWLCRLTQEIKAAEVAAYDEAVEASLKVLSCGDCYAKGFAEAVEKAAKIAFRWLRPISRQKAIWVDKEILTLRPTGSEAASRKEPLSGEESK